MCVILIRVVIENKSITFTHIGKRIWVAGFRNNFPSSAYTVSELIASMAASIIFLSACSRRVFPVEIFLSRDVTPLSAIFIVSSTSSICFSSVCWWRVCGLLIGWY